MKLKIIIKNVFHNHKRKNFHDTNGKQIWMNATVDVEQRVRLKILIK